MNTIEKHRAAQLPASKKAREQAGQMVLYNQRLFEQIHSATLGETISTSYPIKPDLYDSLQQNRSLVNEFIGKNQILLMEVKEPVCQNVEKKSRRAVRENKYLLIKDPIVWISTVVDYYDYKYVISDQIDEIIDKRNGTFVRFLNKVPFMPQYIFLKQGEDCGDKQNGVIIDATINATVVRCMQLWQKCYELKAMHKKTDESAQVYPFAMRLFTDEQCANDIQNCIKHEGFGNQEPKNN